MDASALIPLVRTLIERSQSEWKKGQEALRRRFDDAISRGVAEHHVYVSKWCQEAHCYPVGAVEVDAPTVDLSFRRIPRRVGMSGEVLDELDVLLTQGHVVVLGDPGAGKTTTLRRLASHVALEPEQSPDDNFRLVIVVVCRDERWKVDSLYDVLGRKIGVTGKLAADLDNAAARIRGVLEDIGALILVDGLDEVPRRHRGDLERAITDLGRHLTRAKLVVSCRSGDYVAPLAGFETAEIQPLSLDQIRRVVDSVLGTDEADAFYEAIQSPEHPAVELADRPLFLIQMVDIFKRRGTIPDRPSDLCQTLIRLVIQDWDEQRGVRRFSKYSQFSVDDKRRFLADLAYELMLHHLLRFSRTDIAVAYAGLTERYGLPKTEAHQVARELESHTGLLVQSGEDYEFSHLSLQEVLAADSMVRGPGPALVDWWRMSPAVAAVATAMSSDPNSWFINLMAHVLNKPSPGLGRAPISSFLHRLGQERPRFVRDPEVGVVLLKVVFRAPIIGAEVVAGLAKLKPIRVSVADALDRFDTLRNGADMTRICRYQGRSQTPVEAMSVSTAVLEELVGPEHLREIRQRKQRSRPGPLHAGIRRSPGSA